MKRFIPPGFGALLALCLVLASPAAHAQPGGVVFIPPITPGDCAEWYAPNVLEDFGSTCSGGGGGSPGGSNGQVQYNHSGSFGGITGLTTNGTAATFASSDLILSGSSSGTTKINAAATAGTTTATLPDNSGIVGELNYAQTWSAAQTFNNGDLLLAGSSSGAYTIEAPAAASTYVGTFPAYTGNIIVTNTSSPAQGDILYFDGTHWTDLGVGTSGQFLETQGASANPQWASPSGSGNALFGTTTGNTANDIVTMSNTTVGVQDSGTLLSALAPKANPTFTGSVTATGLITNADLAGSVATSKLATVSGGGTHILATSTASPVQGDVLYFDGTNWADLGYGTSGYFLETQGSGANPTWAAGSGGSGTVTQITSASSNIVVTASTCTTSCTVAATYPNNAQTGTTYTLVAADMGKLVTGSNTGAQTFSMPDTSTTGFGAGASTTAQEINTGALTITDLTSATFSPGAPILTQGQSADFTAIAGNVYNVSGLSLPFMAPNTVLGNGTGSAAWPTSLATTGTGNVVRATSPTLVTPTLGAATATTVNGVTIPSATDTAALLGTAQTFTAANTFTNSDLLLLGSSTGKTTFTSGNSSATNYTATIPANTGTLAELNLAQVWSGQQSQCLKQLTISTTTFTPDGSCNDYGTNLTGADTIANPSATPVAATYGSFYICQDATGSRTVTWGSQYVAAGGVAAIVLSTTASVCDTVPYRVIDSTHILLAAPILNATH